MEKTVDEIYSEMLSVFSEKSGYLPHSSCDLAARLYAAAAQLKGLYHEAAWVLEQSFPQTAQGVYLDNHAALRNITRSVATPATGTLRFGTPHSPEAALTIQAGTVCMTEEGVRFATTRKGELPPGSLYVDIPAVALEPGKAGNVAAGTVTIMSAMPMGINACTNPEAFSGGDDQEDDESLRARLMDSYRRLPNGTNAAYYEQVALSYAGVAAATAVGLPRGVGSVDVYVATDGGVPDQALLEAINRYLQEKREISVDLRVLAPAVQRVNVSVAVTPASGYTLEQARKSVDAALRALFTGALLGKGITLARLGETVYHLDEVANYRFSAPTADLAPSPTTLPSLGTLTVTELEA